jgi:Flp pilus assembly protein TadG
MKNSIIAKFLRDKKGNFALLFAISLAPLMAAVTGVVEFTNVVRTKDALQSSLDAALVSVALDASTEIATSESELEAKGTEYFDTNIDTHIGVDATLDYLGVATMPDNSLRFTADVTKQYKGDLSALLNGPIRVTSAVQRQSGPNACLLALNPTADSALDFNGTTNVNLENCTVAANSKSDASITRSGSATLNSECVQTAGRTSGILLNPRVTLACAKAKENSFKTADPLASVVPPSGVGCSHLNIPHNNGWQTVNPGVYCNNNLTVNGGKKLRFNPGAYVFKGTDIRFLGGAEIAGSGVTFFLYEGAKLNISANSIVNLTAPTTGTYAGILVYTAANNPVALAFAGGATQKLQGFIYNPKGHIDFAGNAGTTSDQCVRLIGDTIKMTGTSKMKVDCKTELANRDITTIKTILYVK